MDMMPNMWTKYRSACDTLGVEYEHTIFDIKAQYRAKALLYHPDKCSEVGAAERFQQVNSAYEYLKGYKESPFKGVYVAADFEEEGSEGSEEVRNDNDSNGVRGSTVPVAPEFKQVIYMIMQKMAKICEKKTRQLLEGFNVALLERLSVVLELYPVVPETIREMVREIVELRRGQTERIIINPLLDDIMSDYLYPFIRDGKTYILPLWHHELVYDVEGEGGEMVIHINPILPENVTIDRDNNLHVYLTYKLLDIWEGRMGMVDGDRESGWVKFYLGLRRFLIPASQICMRENQTVVLVGQGISRICHTDVYDVSQRGDVVVHLSIYHE